MALSLHPESEKHDKFTPGLTRSPNNLHFFQQQQCTDQRGCLPNSHATETDSGMTDINYNSKFLQNLEKHIPTYRNGQVYNRDQFSQLQDAFSSLGMSQQESVGGGRGVNGGSEPSYYCPWNMEQPFDTTMNATFGKDSDLGSSLNRTCGLGSSNGSSGFGTLDDLVSKIVEDDSSLFSSFNGTSDSRQDSGFDGETGLNVNGFWSGGADAATSTPASSKMRHMVDFDSVERPPRPADFLWDTSGSASSGSFLQDGSFLDNLYNVSGATSTTHDSAPPSHHLPQSSASKPERFRYTKQLFNKSPLDANHMRDYEQNGAGDGRHGLDTSPQNNPAFFSESLYNPPDPSSSSSSSSHPHLPPGGGNQGGGAPAASQPDFNTMFNNQPTNSGLSEAAWALANLPDIPGIDKRILAQALVSQASNAFMNPEMFPHRDKLIDSLVMLSDKSNDRDGGASGPPNHHHHISQPIGVMTNQQQNPNQQQHQHHQSGSNNAYPPGSSASISTWSNPSTPNSVAESTMTSSSENHTNNRIPNSYPHKNFPNNKFHHRSNPNHSPVLPTGYDHKRPGFPGPSPPRPGVRGGRNTPFQPPFPPRPHHHLDPSGDAKPGNDRFPNGPFPIPEHLLERGSNNSTPFNKDFPGGLPPHHHRNHFFEEFYPHEYAGLPPFPSHHLKFPHNLPPHIPPEAFEYYPPFDPYFPGRLAPSFFGPGDMFFDMLPPHFYGLPHFFPGFKPPRRTGPSNELHIRLEECYDQFKNLERERKKTEAELARQNPGKKVSSANNVVIPRLPSNPSRVDRLVVDSLREHARVLTLILKMEKLRGEVMHANIHSNMDTWMEGIRKVQARRKEEIINATNRHRNGGPRYQEEKDVLALATSINELTTHTRRARTAMWCALQMSTKEVSVTSLHHLRPSELAAHDAAAAASSSLHQATPAKNDTPTSPSSPNNPPEEKTCENTSTVGTVTEKCPDNNNNA